MKNGSPKTAPPSPLIIVIFALCLCGALSERAEAGAWLPARGDGLILAQNIYSRAVERFDESGGTERLGSFTRQSQNLYMELGLSRNFALIGSLWLSSERERLRGVSERERLWLLGAALRGKIFEKEAWASSWEIGLGYAETRVRPQKLTDEGMTARFAASLGRSGDLFGLATFWEITAHYALDGRDRHYDRAAISQTVGISPFRPFQIAAQFLFEQEIDAPTRPIASHIMRIFGVYQMTPRLAFQLGGVFTLDGQNVEREEGGFAGVILRY